MNQCNIGFFGLWQRICRSFSLASQQYFFPPKFPNVKLALVAIALTVTACSGGGGGGGEGDGGSGSSSLNFVVSGAVSAPGGAVAFLPRKNLLEQFADAFIAPVHAAISGFSPVADGTTVQLVRISDAGVVVSILATTTTSDGRYSFDFTVLGLNISSDLVVQVLDSSNIPKMRAFAASAIVDIDPVSETAARIVLEQAATFPLGNFTTQELADIYSALYLYVMTQALLSGVDIESTVSAFRSAVLADSNIAEFINATAGAGQTPQGPGDIGNYFLFGEGTAWLYQVSEQSDGQTTNYTNTIQIIGTHVTGNGVTTTIFRETNPANSGVTEEDYLVKDSRAITDYGTNDVTDFLTPQIAPYPVYIFPLGINSSFVTIDKTGLSWADEYGDEDEKPEKLGIHATVTVVGFEDVTVPAGTYVNAAKIVSNAVFSVIFSGDGVAATETITSTEWYAPGVGLVKRVGTVEITAYGVTDTTTITEELTDFSPPVPPTPPLVFSNISAGYDFTCGITAEDAAYCWGYGFNGEHGDGTTMWSNKPVAVTGDIKFLSIASGHSHACGIADTGVTYCWGGNFYGQLGNGTTINSTVPVSVLTDVTFTSISVGRFHTCGLTQPGAAYCWGYNSDGELGYSSPSWPNPTPAAVSGGITFASISAGGSHTCGLTTNGVAYCWGGNSFGQLGNTNSPQSSVPAIVTGGIVFASLETGYIHTCGITTIGAVYCWGRNQYGGLGDGTTIDSYAPVPVIGGLTFASITGGDHHTCGVTSNSVAYCWGNNATGAGGNGTTSSVVTIPTAVSGGLSFSSLSAGGEVYTCGVDTGGGGYCWGSNNWGNLGIGESGNKYVPTAVAPP
jgi:alpha-tubulin suppressor-like RCC1 family protein